MYLLPQFIQYGGLSEFVLYGLRDGLVLDLGEMRHLFEDNSELRKLSIKNTSKIDPESLVLLITMICDLIRSRPPRLTDLDFESIGGSAEQGRQIMEALLDSELQVKNLKISKNRAWTKSESYSPLLCSLLYSNANLASLNIVDSWTTKETKEQGLIVPVLSAAQNLQELIYQKTCKNVQKLASQVLLDPIQKHATSRSLQLKVVQLKALL